MSNSGENSKKVLPRYQDIGYFNIPAAFSREAFESVMKYKPRSDDLFVVSFPKCGSTWVQNIVACIYKNGKPFSNVVDFFSNAPFLQMTGIEAAETMQRPNAIKVHLPFHLMPYSLETKYIFVARNPKDCCVSFYHHTKNLSLYQFKDGSFDDYFELFINGKVDFGDYFDTLTSWYDHRNDPNVLFLTYEELQKENEKNMLKIAEFMGKRYKDVLESHPTRLKDVIRYSSFNYMKEFINKQMEEMARLPPEFILSNPDVPLAMRNLFQPSETGMQPFDSFKFIRKGIIGDWRNHFSEEQNRRMDAKFRERTKGTGIEELWQKEMALIL